MNAEELERFHRSLERVTHDPAFLDRFYDAFMAISPEIAAIFEDTDMDRLKRKLKSSLHVMTLAIDDAPGADDYLRFLGRSHRRFSLEARHFDLWMDSLVETAAACDPKFSDDLAATWRTVIGSGIDLMRAGMRPRERATA